MAENGNTAENQASITESSVMAANLSAKRDKLIKTRFDDPSKEVDNLSTNNTVVDVISDYTWNNEVSKSVNTLSYNIGLSIPSCFAIEREQTVASSIMNIVRDANIVASGYEKVIGVLNTIISGTDNPEKGILGTGGSDNVKRLANKLMPGGDQIFKQSKVDGASLHKGILSPYNFLYATKMTGFKFVFPMLTSTDLYKINNTWVSGQDSNTSYLLHNPISQMLSKISEGISNSTADVANLLALYQNKEGGVSSRGSVFEMAKYFNFDTQDTDEVTISFVLFNTIVKNGIVDQWKRNLYFISLFNLRNLPFKLDYTTYLPPLLYDIIIPGVKRLPFAYVSSFSAEPQGLIRNMKIENFLSRIAGAATNENKNVSVPVPEAWTVSITFKSMLARSANLMLAGGADLPITINMSESDAAKDKTIEEYNQFVNKMKEEREAAAEKAKNTNVIYENVSENMAKNATAAINKLLYGETAKKETYNLTGLTSAEGDNIKLSSNAKWNVENNQSLEDKLLGRIGTNTTKNNIIFNT